MAKGLFGGKTDYSHQSFQDILDDLEKEKINAIYFRDNIEKNIDILTSNSYWDNNVHYDFKNIVAYALKLYNTVITEFDELGNDLIKKVKKHHIKQLERISTVASDINIEIGKIWHNKYNPKDYKNPNFILVEDIYRDTRDMAVNLLDIANIADRLDDFIGKTNPNITRNNPLISGLFYLFVAIVLLTVLAVISKLVTWTLLPIIIIGGILLTVIIGVLQLKNDNRITDKSFVTLVIETYKRFPLIGEKTGNDTNRYIK